MAEKMYRPHPFGKATGDLLGLISSEIEEGPHYDTGELESLRRTVDNQTEVLAQLIHTLYKNKALDWPELENIFPGIEEVK